MSIYQEIRQLINDLRNKVRRDQEIPDKLHNTLIVASSAVEERLGQMEQMADVNEEKVRKLHEHAQRLSLMLENIKNLRYPSYVDEFIPSIASNPYTMPETFYRPQGASQITINIDGQLKSERAEQVLLTLFPGSISFRYASPAIKVKTGSWFRSGRARLSNIHTFSTKPEFELEEGNRLLRVYKPETLNAFRLIGQHYLCTTCLSLSDRDENCTHSTLQPRRRLPSSSSIIRRIELSRTPADTKALLEPLSLLIPQVTFLSNVEVGLAVVGFERIATIGSVSRVTRVDYDPAIGIRLLTTGLCLAINVPEKFSTEIMTSNPILKRDMIINLVSHELAAIMSATGLPSYHHELILSAVIKALDLDNVTDETLVLAKLRSETLIPTVNALIDHELRFYESSAPTGDLLHEVLTALQSLEITQEKILVTLKQNILHSLAHLVLLAAAVTSGSELNDLDYLINKNTNEIILFDSVSGGNGSSETVFDFLSAANEFTISAYLDSEERQEIYKPRYFDETVFEFLLPCINGVSDRLFFFGTIQPNERELRRKLNELREKENTHKSAISRIQAYGTDKLYPITIGYHAVDYTQNPQDAARFKEAATICLHGCPECISIGRKCHNGAFYEKYGISKLLLDELLSYLLREATIYEFSTKHIVNLLSKFGFAVINIKFQDKKTYQKVMDGIDRQLLELKEQQIDNKHIKYAGHWINLDLKDGKLNYYFMLKAI